MSLEGRINVDALFHDKDGTNAVSVVSLQSSEQYTTGKVAIITGTAGTAQTTITLSGIYNDASGSPVIIDQISKVLFSWNNPIGYARRLELIDVDDFALCTLVSRNKEIAASSVSLIVDARLSASANNTGTYTIVVFGEQ